MFEKDSQGSDRIESPTLIITEETTQVVNASGYKDQLNRQYGAWSAIALSLTVDNAWVAFGGALTLTIANGGPAGALYEFLVACVYYAFIAASLAELASAVPTSAGVYAWASLTAGPRYGRVVGFYVGWINYWAWLAGFSSFVLLTANVAIQMYSLFHPEYVYSGWSAYITYLIIVWSSCAIVIFGNRFLPFVAQTGMFFVTVGGLITVIVIAAVPKIRASNFLVWGDFDNTTGWSDGTAFLIGVLQGVYTIGTSEAVCHLAEEMTRPRVQLPLAILGQMVIGTLATFVFAVAIFYGISDLDAVVSASGAFPLATIYLQATNNSTAATFGLLLIVFLALAPAMPTTLLFIGRIWWTLARDTAVPFSTFFSHVDEARSCPIEATVMTALLITGLGAIQLGSPTAFQDLAGSGVTLGTIGYGLAFAGHLFTGRKSVPRGPFWMSGIWGYLVNSITVALIVFFNIMFCFPTFLPVQSSTMNYNSVILVGVVFLATIWWGLSARKNYPGPLVMRAEIHIESK